MRVHRSNFLFSALICAGMLFTSRETSAYGAQEDVTREECTVAVVSGSATVDGRPLLWKNRDTSFRDNEIAFFSGLEYDFVGVINTNDVSQVWMGLNTAGFAIMNSESLDLEGDSLDGEGYFMKAVLGSCTSVRDFERVLERTNRTIRTTKANFGVIDAHGDGAIFETGNATYTKFDVNDSRAAPHGYIVRTNFAMTGEGKGSGHARYKRAEKLFSEAMNGDPFSFQWILRIAARDLVNEALDPYPLPYKDGQDSAPRGFINTQNSINRHRTASAAVFHGVRRGEDPSLASMWCILGEPVCGVAIPLWARAHGVPPEVDGMSGSRLNAVIQSLEARAYPDEKLTSYLNTAVLLNEEGGGMLPQLLEIEDWVFTTVERRLITWRTVYPSSTEMRKFELNLIKNVINRLQSIR